MNAQTKWNFDTVIDRRNTDSIKWDSAFLKDYFKGEDLLPLWVADMDFSSPQPVIDALVKRAKHGIFGYSAPSSEDYPWYAFTRIDPHIQNHFYDLSYPSHLPHKRCLFRFLSPNSS